MYLLDTNTCIAFLRRKVLSVARRLKEVPPTDVRICSIVKAELIYGARKSTMVAENMMLLDKFFSTVACVPFDDRSAEHYGFIRADLERSGTPIGPNDLLIGSVARAHDMTLVSRNTREFSRIVGLRLENWEQ